MQSLRTRRSQPQRRPTKLAKPGDPPTRRDTRGKSRVDDKIKKRMSARYADISSPTELSPDAIRVPTIPYALLAGRGRSPGASFETESEDAAKGRTARDDKRLLDAEDFDPDAFLKLKLANSTEAELKSLQSSLHAVKEDTASDLQRTVFKNYAEFVLISKEISTLENELAELKESLSEYKSMPSLLHIPDPTTISSSTLSTYKRSSIADLRIMYFNQMQALHASIEGAAKFAPTTPGRHVVSEMEGIYSLNAATYKATGKVRFVVLDDAVLVARRRRRNGGTEGRGASGTVTGDGKLVAERCWPLNEMLVLDTKDSSTMTNVFKIKHGKEMHVYRTDSPTDKKALLAQFRQVAEELAEKKRKEREGEHERRKTMLHSGDHNALSMPEWMADLARRGGDIPGVASDAKEKADRDVRWTNDWADELTVAIALREWTKAVELVEKAEDRLAVTPPLEAKLPPLRSQLIAALLNALSKPTIRKSAVVSLISLLIRLKAGSAARNTLLRMRSQVIQSHARNIKFEGDISAYIGELAIVYFTGIKHSADWFLASFKENEVASSFIEWAKKEIEDYAEIFRKQVFTPDIERKVVLEAVKFTHTQSRKLLQEYGLDFTYLFNELLVEKPKEILKHETTFSFTTHNRVSTLGQSSTSTPKKEKEKVSTNGRRTPPNQNITSPYSETAPPVPTLPLRLKKSSSSQPSKSSEPDRASTSTTSSTSAEPVLSLPALTSPGGRYSPQPLSAASVYATTPTSATAATASNSLDGLLSPPGNRSLFSVPSRSGLRTPTSSKESSFTKPAQPYTSPLSSPVTKIPRSPVNLATSMPSISSAMASASGLANGAGMNTSGRTSGFNSNRPVAIARETLEREEPPSALRAGVARPPLPPTRSSNRPRSSHRPPPVAVPQREGMI
ncbi:hypothetical protein AX17_000871 [Amanita inopinata Kibby_2008]|nr:hypothetical protein AX17_000871 [Amanita inopinata Kibby_2008]